MTQYNTAPLSLKNLSLTSVNTFMSLEWAREFVNSACSVYLTLTLKSDLSLIGTSVESEPRILFLTFCYIQTTIHGLVASVQHY